MPLGWNNVTGNMVFRVKMDFTRKARWVLDGRDNLDPEVTLYYEVFSREIIMIALTYAALNGLDMVVANIRNACLKFSLSQKEYIVYGPESVLENIGKKELTRKALYGGKAAGCNFRNNLRECAHNLYFESCPADTDVWKIP